MIDQEPDRLLDRLPYLPRPVRPGRADYRLAAYPGSDEWLFFVDHRRGEDFARIARVDWESVCT